MRSAIIVFSASMMLLGLLLPVATISGPSVARAESESCAGEAGHAHGHLDFLKKVGDPATGSPSGSKGFGFVTFSSDGEADRFAGVLRIGEGSGRTSVFVAEGGECTLEGGGAVLTIALRNLQTGEELLLLARAEDVDGPGTFPVSITLDPPRFGVEIVGVFVLVFAR